MQLESAVKQGADSEKKLAEIQSQSDSLRQSVDGAASRVADADARIAALQIELERARSDASARAKEVNIRVCCSAIVFVDVRCYRLPFLQK